MTLENRWVRAPHHGSQAQNQSSGASVHAVIVSKRREKVCSEFDKDTEIEQLRETLEVEYGKAGSAAARLDAKLKVVRHLKRLFRCEGSFEEGAREVTALAPEIETEARQSAVTVLGGHLVGIAPWARATRIAFESLGARTERLEEQDIPGDAWGPGTTYTAAVHRELSTASARTNTKIFQRAQIVACLGHHYTSHLAPGVFTNSNSSRGFDLRYDIANRPHGFQGVALMAVTGCSMTCNLAQSALQAAFPRARFLGSRKTMPLRSGSKIWPAFDDSLSQDATPLILDNTQDIEQATRAWLHANIVGLRSEAERLLRKSTASPSDSQIERKLQRILETTGPGFAEGRHAHRLLSPALETRSVPLGATENSCSRKADDRNVLVPPKGLVLPGF